MIVATSYAAITMAHEHEPRDRHQHANQKPAGMKPHMKWTAVLAVVAMLVALAFYVFSDDEILTPTTTPTNVPQSNP